MFFMVIFDLKEARELVRGFNVKEAMFFHKIVSDALSIEYDEDYSVIEEALQEKIKNFSSAGFPYWILTPVEIRDFFFKLSVNNMASMSTLIRKCKEKFSKYDMIYDLAELVYQQTHEMVMHKRIESMTYEELYHYICEVTRFDSFYGSSSLDDYLFGDFISDNKRQLTDHVYNKFHNKEVEGIVRKYTKEEKDE